MSMFVWWMCHLLHSDLAACNNMQGTLRSRDVQSCVNVLAVLNLFEALIFVYNALVHQRKLLAIFSRNPIPSPIHHTVTMSETYGRMNGPSKYGNIYIYNDVFHRHGGEDFEGDAISAATLSLNTPHNSTPLACSIPHFPSW